MSWVEEKNKGFLVKMLQAMEKGGRCVKSARETEAANCREKGRSQTQKKEVHDHK